MRKDPDWSKYKDFLQSENRYRQLMLNDPETAERLYEINLKDAQRRYQMYKRYAAMDYSEII
jgi:pyruvate-ferredoxin/flavodoxin oxidoreductase